MKDLKSVVLNKDQMAEFKILAKIVDDRLNDNSTFLFNEFATVQNACIPDSLKDIILNVMQLHNKRLLDSSNT